MQRRLTVDINCIHISASSQVLFDGFNVSYSGGFVN